VEYTFKNTVSDRACSIVLDREHFTIQTGGSEKQIPYSKIRVVRLSRSNGTLFKMTVKSKNSDKIQITNKYYLPTGEYEDRSKEYSNFVRTFHSHLQEKSNPRFISAENSGTLVLGVLVSAFISVFISFVLEFFGMNFIHPALQATLLIGATVASIYISHSRSGAATYKPDHIPNQFLP
jgi:hypothetical protein